MPVTTFRVLVLSAPGFWKFCLITVAHGLQAGLLLSSQGALSYHSNGPTLEFPVWLLNARAIRVRLIQLLSLLGDKEADIET